MTRFASQERHSSAWEVQGLFNVVVEQADAQVFVSLSEYPGKLGAIAYSHYGATGVIAPP